MYNMSVRTYFVLLAIVLFAIRCRCNEFGGPVSSMQPYGYHAAVLIVINDYILDACGGTILSKYHVLTTASCFADLKYDYYDIQVRVGSVKYVDGGDLYEVSKVEQHPEFDQYDSTHNLAIVFVTNPIVFVSPTVTLAGGISYTKSVYSALLTNDFIIGGEQVKLTTYSKKALLKHPVNEMEDMRTYTVNFFKCADIFKKTFPRHGEIVRDDILCIEYADFDGNCDIMEGSPVVSEFKLIGIYVKKFDSCTFYKRHPLLVTRISNKYLWINQHVNADRFKNPVYNGPTCAPIQNVSVHWELEESEITN